jgi:hypothetical protein
LYDRFYIFLVGGVVGVLLLLLSIMLGQRLLIPWKEEWGVQDD